MSLNGQAELIKLYGKQGLGELRLENIPYNFEALKKICLQ